MASAGVAIDKFTNIDHLVVTPKTRGWYTDQSSAGSSVDILQQAYKEATAIFAKELTHDEYKRAWSQSRQSMDDVLDAILVAKKKYDSKPGSKARKWLSVLSSKVTYYGSIMDVLIQQYPEYASLAWGAMKFLFVTVINHEELIKQISKAFCRIAETLPRTDLVLILYPTDIMRETVAHLYAQIIKFIQKAILWYKKSPLAHAWAAVAKPWSLSFQDVVEDIRALSQQVDDLANAASKVELRDTHWEIAETRIELQLARRQIAAIQDLFGNKTDDILKIVTATQNLQQRLELDFSEQKEMIHSVQLTQILSLPFMQQLPTSGASLGYCQSVRARGRWRTSYRLPEISTLEKWSSEPRTSMLLTQNRSTQTAKDFLVDLVSLIQQNKIPVIWALRFPNFWDQKPTYMDILQMLVVQALQINPSALSGSPSPINIVHFREASNEDDWLALLNQALLGLPYVYIILDADLLSYASDNSKYRATKMVEKFPGIITTTKAKVFVSTSNIDSDYVMRNWDPKGWTRLHIEDNGGLKGSPYSRSNARRQRKVRARYNVLNR